MASSRGRRYQQKVTIEATDSNLKLLYLAGWFVKWVIPVGMVLMCVNIPELIESLLPKAMFCWAIGTIWCIMVSGLMWFSNR